jgi:hypothetical protein
MGNLMRGKGVYLFMWQYQNLYVDYLKSLANKVFEKLGIYGEPQAFIVGVRRPGSEKKNEVCLEPEDGAWSIDLFTGLLNKVEEIHENHPDRYLIYDNRDLMNRKAKSIRRASVSIAIENALKSYDDEYKVRSFCGMSYPVDDYYIVPVIQVSEEVFNKYPPLQGKIGDKRISGYSSFIHAAISETLVEASNELRHSNPSGKSPYDLNPAHLIHQAATNFLKTPGKIINTINGKVKLDSWIASDIFEHFNFISQLMYEGTKGKGRLLLVNSENPAIKYHLRLIEPVPFREPRWARKTLQMASQDIMLIADCEKIHGLGKLNENHDATQQDAFIVDFLDHYHWQLRCGEQVLIQSKYGVPSLPQEVISRDRFLDNYSRLFPQTSPEQQNHIWQLFTCAIKQNHGSSLIVANDAESEAQRLALQGTSIQPTLMTEELFQRVSGIDGTIILDPFGVCHAIGVILDGVANELCTPSRGSRFNSGVRYVEADKKQRLAIVVSDDKIVDIFPLLRPRIEKIEVINVIEQLEQATEDNYHIPRKWLDKHRFYLDAEQCERINMELDRINNLPKEVGKIRYLGNYFEPHPEMDESYFLSVK